MPPCVYVSVYVRVAYVYERASECVYERACASARRRPRNSTGTTTRGRMQGGEIARVYPYMCMCARARSRSRDTCTRMYDRGT